jgi:hypothetical protein
MYGFNSLHADTVILSLTNDIAKGEPVWKRLRIVDSHMANVIANRLFRKNKRVAIRRAFSRKQRLTLRRELFVSGLILLLYRCWFGMKNRGLH